MTATFRPVVGEILLLPLGVSAVFAEPSAFVCPLPLAVGRRRGRLVARVRAQWAWELVLQLYYGGDHRRRKCHQR